MPDFRHLTSTTQLNRIWIESELFPLCYKLREQKGASKVLEGSSIYCLFYEPSFLTRTSFELAMGLLGGTAYHTEDASQFYPVKTPDHIDNVINILASLHVDLVVLRSSEENVVSVAAQADAVPIVNGGSLSDHPTQALADIFTLNNELGAIDGISIAIVGRLDHRNVSALLRCLSLYDNVTVNLFPLSGQADPEVLAYCRNKGLSLVVTSDIGVFQDVDAIYLNGPRTRAHAQLLKSRGSLDLHINRKFMSNLKPHCVILDPMQRSGDFIIEVDDSRLAFYRQSENGLLIKMALLTDMLHI